MMVKSRAGPLPTLEAREETTIALSSRWLWSFILYVIPALAVLSILASLIKRRSESGVMVEISDRFIMNVETSLPTVLSFVLMLTASQLSLLIFLLWQRFRPTPLNVYWLAVSLLMVAAAYDEVAQAHEKLPAPFLSEILGGHGWIIIATASLLVIALLFVPFLLVIPRHMAKRLLLSAAIFLLGAIVIEGLSALYVFKMGRDFIYDLITVLEESVELVGVSYLNLVLFEHVVNNRLVLRFSENGNKRGASGN